MPNSVPHPITPLKKQRSWQIERPERCPLWNVIYGALTGRPCELDAVPETLREIPSDLRHRTTQNSQRPDVELDPEASRFGEAQSRRVLPAHERPMMKWNGNPYRLDGGDGGRTEEDGTFFLLLRARKADHYSDGASLTPPPVWPRSPASRSNTTAHASSSERNGSGGG